MRFHLLAGDTLLSRLPDGFWYPHSLLQHCLPFPAVERSDCGADLIHTSNSDFKNEWNSNTNPHMSSCCCAIKHITRINIILLPPYCKIFMTFTYVRGRSSDAYKQCRSSYCYILRIKKEKKNKKFADWMVANTQESNLIVFMVAPCINNIKYFIVQLTHSILIVGLLKHIKNAKAAPTCFGSRRNHHQGAKVGA